MLLSEAVQSYIKNQTSPKGMPMAGYLIFFLMSDGRG